MKEDKLRMANKVIHDEDGVLRKPHHTHFAIKMLIEHARDEPKRFITKAIIGIVFLALGAAFAMVLGSLAGCKASKEERMSQVRALAVVQHKCPESKVRFVRYENPNEGPPWVIFDVCGTQRYYEYGQWCEDCDRTWRERMASSVLKEEQIPMITIGDVLKASNGSTVVTNRHGSWKVTWKKER